MNVIEHPEGTLKSCFIETSDNRVCCLMNTEEPEILECITVDDDDEIEIENAKCPLKIKEIFPCAITSGCNIMREDEEPDHLLKCLIVKILKEKETPVADMESLCLSLSKTYKFFYNTPPYKLVQEIKETIQTEFLEKYRIVINSRNQCVLLPEEGEVISLDSDDDFDSKSEHGFDNNNNEIEIVYDTMISEEPTMVVCLPETELPQLNASAISMSTVETTIAPQSEEDPLSIQNTTPTPLIETAAEENRVTSTTPASNINNVYAMEEERYVQSSVKKKSSPKRAIIIDDHQVPVPRPGIKEINNIDWIIYILETIRRTNWGSFSAQDMVQYLKDQWNFKEKYLYQKVHKTLRAYPMFKQSSDKRWRLISLKSPEKLHPQSSNGAKHVRQPHKKPSMPSLSPSHSGEQQISQVKLQVPQASESLRILTNSKSNDLSNRTHQSLQSHKNLGSTILARSSPNPSLLLLFAQTLRRRELEEEEVFKEISKFQPKDKRWKQVVRGYLEKFCIKFSSQRSTSYYITEDTYIQIYRNEVISKEFNFKS